MGSTHATLLVVSLIFLVILGSNLIAGQTFSSNSSEPGKFSKIEVALQSGNPNWPISLDGEKYLALKLMISWCCSGFIRYKCACCKQCITDCDAAR